MRSGFSGTFVLANLILAPAVAAQSSTTGLITPWDVYLSCRGTQATAASSQSSLDPHRDDRLDRFCGLQLPRIGTRYTETERQRWNHALANLPDANTLDHMRRDGEQWLLDRVNLLGQFSIGGIPLEFPPDGTRLSDQQRQAIRVIAREFLERLRQNPGERLFVTGYADNNRGGVRYNQNLAERRAEAVVEELRANGIDEASIRTLAEVITVPHDRIAIPEARAVALTLPSSRRSLDADAVRQARAGGVDISTVLIGSTEFLITEARQQVEHYLIRSGTTQLCATAQWRDVLPITCELVPPIYSVNPARTAVRSARSALQSAQRDSVLTERHLREMRRVHEEAPDDPVAAATVDTAEERFDSAHQLVLTRRRSLAAANARLDTAKKEQQRTPEQRYFPGVELLRNAIAEDLRGLPFRVSSQSLIRIASEHNSEEVRERAILALYLLRYIDEIGRAEPPFNALRSAVRFVEDSVHHEFPIVTHLRRASALSELITSGRADLRLYWDGEALTDSATLYTVKAFVLNLHAAKFDSGVGPLGQVDLDELIATLLTAQSIITSIEQRWAELRDLSSDSSTFGATRRALAARIADDAVSLGVALLPSHHDGVQHIMQPVPVIRDLAIALTERNAPQVLNNLMHLGQSIQAGRMLSSDQMRVLAFSTDIAQARTTAQVQSTFQRFVSAGPGFHGKRASTRSFWRVNAYAGLAGAWESLADADQIEQPSGLVAALTLPIGVEIGRPILMNSSQSLFVQVLDLGAVASARITSTEDVQTFPRFSFGSVVAPGISYVQSFGGSPFVGMAGVAYIPQARETRTGREWGGYRLSLGVAVDVPLFP